MRLLLLGLLLCSALTAEGRRFTFNVAQGAEIVAELDLSSPGSDWAVAGREAAVAVLSLDGKSELHVMLFAGPARFTYRVLLGAVGPGKHELVIDRHSTQSAPASELEVHAARFHEYSPAHADYSVLAHAPVLFARANTVGQFSDIPLLVYAERLADNGQPVLQYTVVFSNEDGGTSTRALMARWGRASDIEYVYRVWLAPDGSAARAIVQGRDHKDVPYAGKRSGNHPLLLPVTDNNMVEPGESAVRYQLAPVLVDLSRSAREQVMDDQPVTYQVMGKELVREKKLRPFGVVAGENISDLRNYAFLEYRATHSNSAFAVSIDTKEGRSYTSDLGRLDYAIDRDGWVRTTVELPPDITWDDVERICFECKVAAPGKDQPWAQSGRCELGRVNKLFFLDENGKPAKPVWSLTNPISIPTGQSAIFRP